MRILHCLASPVFSGPAENVLELALAQRRLGHEVAVAVDRKRSNVVSEEPLVPRLLKERLLDDGGLELSVKSTPWAVARDIARLRKRNLDVVHSHFSHDHFVAALGKPQQSIVVRSLHAPRSLRRLMPNADAYTVPFEKMKWKVSSKTPVVELPALVSERFVVCPDKATLKSELGLTGSPLIGMVSTFQRSRRHDLALLAFSRLLTTESAARLVLVGDGILEQEIRNRVVELNLSSAVTLAGYQEGEGFVRWLQALDEVWVLGLGNDFSARVAAQARACGVRVVAVNEGALSRWADDLLSDLSVDDIVQASLSRRVSSRQVMDASVVARDVLNLYQEAFAT